MTGDYSPNWEFSRPLRIWTDTSGDYYETIDNIDEFGEEFWDDFPIFLGPLDPPEQGPQPLPCHGRW